MSEREEEGTRTQDQEERDISFFQRLQRHFGNDLDPAISLQGDGEEEPEPVAEERAYSEEDTGEDSTDSATSSALLKKLSQHVELGSRFEIKSEIARGGMGIIFRVWDEDLRRNLAMKVMHKKSSISDDTEASNYDQEKLGRFLEEAQITGQLDHPGIVPVHDLGIDSQGRCYFTMRLVRGRELKEVLDLARANKENWNRTKALGLILKVCESMAFAHSKGVVHRDLKPQNIMVGRFGEVYVMDWGLARVIDRSGSRADSDQADSSRRETPPEHVEPSSISLVRTVRREESLANPDSPLITMDGDVVGTPSFMSLEQAQGKLSDLGPRSDVYSLGAILYYMLTGRSPYVQPGERLSPHTVLNRVLTGPPESVEKQAASEPPELIAICKKAMSRDSNLRYGGMLEVAEDIQAYLGNRVVSAYEGGSLAEARKWIERNRGMALAIAGMVLLTLVSAVGFAIQQQRRVDELDGVNLELRAATDKADENARRATESARAADRNEKEAIRSLELAEASEQDAERSLQEARAAGYRANILAADFSLRLDDVKEAKLRLKISDPPLREWEHRHLDLRTRAAIESLGNGRKGAIEQVEWARDGNEILVLSRDAQLRSMRPVAGAGRDARSFSIGGVSASLLTGVAVPVMALPADRARVASVGTDEYVRVFDLAKRKEILKLPLEGDEGHSAHVGAVAYTEDGSLLLSGSEDGELIAWRADGGIEFRIRPGLNGSAVTCVAWNPDATFFAAGFADGVLLVRNRDFPTVREKKLEGHQGAVRALTFDDQGGTIFSAGQDGRLNQWNHGRGLLVASYTGHRGGLRALDFDPVHGLIATASEDRTLRLWDLSGGGSRVLLGHESDVLSVSFSPDGRTLASSDRAGYIKTWDVLGNPSISSLEFHTSEVGAVAFSPGGEFIATGDKTGEVVLWDALSTEPILRMRGHTDEIVALVFAPEGPSLFSASGDHTVRRWDTQSGVELAVYPHSQAVTGLFINAAGTQIVTGSYDKNIRTFDVASGRIVNEFVGYRRALSRIKIHPDGMSFAGLSGNDVLIWKLDGKGEPRKLNRVGVFRDLAFSPDGEKLVTAARNGEVSTWSLQTNGCLGFRKDHEGAVSAVAFHPTGKRFASGGRDGTVRIREVDTGRELLVLTWPGEEIRDLAFGPEGARLIGTSKSGAVRIWETDLVLLRRELGRESKAARTSLAPLVERLFDEHFFMREVVRELEADDSLSADLREQAVRMSRFRGDDPRLLYRLSLLEVLPGREPEAAYARALARAQAAHGMRGGEETPGVLLALGAAKYRALDYGSALAALERADERNELLGLAGNSPIPRLTAEEEVIRLIFLAMVRFQRGRHALGANALEDALARRERMGGLAAFRGVGDLWNEAADLIFVEE